MNWLTILLKRKHKNSKLAYYLRCCFREIKPAALSRLKLQKKLLSLSDYDTKYISRRISYYNKLKNSECCKNQLPQIFNFKLPKKQRVYYFDTYEYLRFFSKELRFAYLKGDITYVPDVPSIVKSRPIGGDNANSVILNLDKVRHFTFLNDSKPFTQKKDMLIGRAVVAQPHRIRFYEMYFPHPLCNLGQINSNENSDRWQVPKISIKEHLDYKFILCLEGNDVATNLKWVMSSNSLAIMPRPKYETWYMEGTLIPNFHYVEIKKDYSDLEERLRYYIEHTDEALQIIQNAHEYVAQFKNKKQEDLISLLVLKKYFEQTGQYLT
jgi:Arabidopsis thaliana protein of unknown function (DUF821).